MPFNTATAHQQAKAGLASVRPGGAGPHAASLRKHKYSGNSEYSLGLDLLRALAIILVMCSHYANNFGYWLHIDVPQKVFFMGDLGVDLFFALSGFLIGRILIDICARGPTLRHFRVFMIRRWLRTLPLYFLCLVLLFALFPPPADARADAWHFATLTQNLLQPMPPDFFFAVSWSLTIEEWFYVLFAGMLIGATRLLRRPRLALGVCLAVFLVGPLVLRLHYLDFSPAALDLRKQVFFRIDEIAYGVVMAFLYIKGSVVFRHPWPLLAVGIVMIGMVWAGKLPIPVALWPALTINVTIIGCALCLPAALRLRQAPAWFARPVRAVSGMSYALYLIHITILVDLVQSLWGTGRISAPAAMALALGLPFILAWLSRHWLEQPILRRRPAQ